MDPINLTDSDIIQFVDNWNGDLPNLFNSETFESEVISNEVELQPPTGSLPCLEEWEGSLGFSISIQKNNASKSYHYSHLLKSVFIRMNNVLMVGFRLTHRPGTPLFIRALLVYMSSDFANLPVNRCIIHSIDDDPENGAHPKGVSSICRCEQYNHVGHVIRCQSVDTVYCYNAESERHSVKVPVPEQQAGSDYFNLPYTFACKTSCRQGMQLRPVQIVFTLEDASCKVLGRRVLPIKICSCPKRDMIKQEEVHLAEHNNVSFSKKRKVPDAVPQFPQIIKVERLTEALNDIETNNQLTVAVNQLRECRDSFEASYDAMQKAFEEVGAQRELINGAIQNVLDLINRNN